MNALDRLQAFFRELFLLDLADLDFGIYRLYHLKQEEIETFIAKQLPREVARLSPPSTRPPSGENTRMRKEN